MGKLIKKNQKILWKKSCYFLLGYIFIFYIINLAFLESNNLMGISPDGPFGSYIRDIMVPIFIFLFCSFYYEEFGKEKIKVELLSGHSRKQIFLSKWMTGNLGIFYLFYFPFIIIYIIIFFLGFFISGFKPVQDLGMLPVRVVILILCGLFYMLINTAFLKTIMCLKRNPVYGLIQGGVFIFLLLVMGIALMEVVYFDTKGVLEDPIKTMSVVAVFGGINLVGYMAAKFQFLKYNF